MTSRYVDVHSHLQFEQFAHDEADIIKQIEENGIATIMVGVDVVSSRKALALAEKYEHLYAAVGLHPNHAEQEFFDETAYRALAEHSKVVAIGECGLDYYRAQQVSIESPLSGLTQQAREESSAYLRPAEVNDDVKNKQKELLRKHIRLACGLNKPLIIHCRPSKGTQDAYHDLIAILQEAKTEHPKLRGDIHFFVGGVEEAEAFFVLDFTISFTAVITFARDYDEVIRSIPLRNILSETDAPYLAPVARRGERNDPLAVIDVVQKIAEIRGEDPESVRRTLLANARRVFALSGLEIT
ncbi:MAG: TatD family hydrolase [Minisyncoccia bacterium]